MSYSSLRSASKQPVADVGSRLENSKTTSFEVQQPGYNGPSKICGIGSGLASGVSPDLFANLIQFAILWPHLYPNLSKIF